MNRWTDRRTGPFIKVLGHSLKLKSLKKNKANLRDLIAATGLVILLKFDPNRGFSSLCELEI